MKTIIVGNGILGLTTAYRLIKRDQNAEIIIIGPEDNKGCASLAAAAMFNSFCEIDSHTLSNNIEKQKWLFNKSSTPYWPNFLKEIQHDSGIQQEYGFGTYLINNHVTDDLEDENFDAIVNALKEYNEPFSYIDPKTIKNYNPDAQGRAARGIYIDGEGWVNPTLLMLGLKKALLKNNNVKFIHAYAEHLIQENGIISHVVLDNKSIVQGDIYFVAPGATFSKIMEASNFKLNFPKIFYGVGSSILLKTDTKTLSNCVRTPNRGLACGVYSAPQDSEHTLVGASNFISPWPEDFARITSVYTLLKSAMEQINTDYYRSHLVKVNVGWRPTSEDTLPLLGKTTISNLLVATGTKRDGLHCSPVISEFISDLILDGKSKHDLSLFTPERDVARIYTREEAISIVVRHTINAAYQHDFKPSKNRMIEQLEKFYQDEFNQLHDKVGAHDWGIPPEMVDMYKYGHTK